MIKVELVEFGQGCLEKQIAAGGLKPCTNRLVRV